MNRRNIWLWLAIFIGLRLVFIKSLPIFNDESAYLHWGKIITNNWSLWWFPLAFDGRQPGTAIMLGLGELLPLNALVAGRLVSVFFATVTFIFTLKSADVLGLKNKVILVFLLSFTPLLLFFDRLAFSESAMAAFSALLFYQTLQLLDRQNVKKGFLLGVVLAMGWWIKSTVLLLLLPMGLVFFLSWYKDRKSVSVKLILAAAGGFLMIAWPILINQFFLNNPQSEIHRVSLTTPDIWWRNLVQITDWLIAFLTPLVMFLTLIGLISQTRKIRLIGHKKTLLVCWTVIPLVTMVFVSKILSARYLVFLVPEILILASLTIEEFNKQFQIAIQSLVLAGVIILGILAAANPQSFSSLYLKYFPQSRQDFDQYITGWTSGYGVEEAAEYIKSRSAGKQSLVLVRQDNGNPEDAMFDFLDKEPNIRVGYLNVLQQVAQVPKDQRQNVDLYFVSRGGQYAGLEKYLTEVKRFPKPTGREFIGVYKINI